MIIQKYSKVISCKKVLQILSKLCVIPAYIKSKRVQEKEAIIRISGLNRTTRAGKGNSMWKKEWLYHPDI